MEIYEQVRDQIETAKSTEIRMFLKAAYLLGAQGYELTGKFDSPMSKRHRKPNVIYGPKGTDVSKVTIVLKNDCKADVALFRIRSSGHNVISNRVVALPICSDYDPWVEELFDFFLTKKDDYVFLFNRQKVWNYITTKDRVFAGLKFRTRMYKFGGHLTCHAHSRAVKIHHLPILRSYELTDKYGFNTKDRELYYGSVTIKRGFSALTNGSSENKSSPTYLQKLLRKM